MGNLCCLSWKSQFEAALVISSQGNKLQLGLKEVLKHRLPLSKSLPKFQAGVMYRVWLSQDWFPCSSPHGAVFYVGSWQGVDSTLVLWLLLSSAYTAPRLFLTFPPHSGTGWARSWEGTQPGQLTRTDQRDIPYHMTSAQYKAGRKEEGGGVTLGPPRQPLRISEPCFLRRPDIAC